MPSVSDRSRPTIRVGKVVANARLCRDHYRLSFHVGEFPKALAGQFVHLCPANAAGAVDSSGTCASIDWGRWAASSVTPMLRRAFSIAGLRRGSSGVEVDVIYRVVGAGTRWLETLQPGNEASALGPLGNRFPISETKRHAWLVAGGVGLPPMLWLAEALRDASKTTIAFCGAQTRDLLALTVDAEPELPTDATRASDGAAEFSRVGARVIISTDDGSLGFRGRVGNAMEAYHRANPVPADDLVVYTCGPEPMMHFVAEYCTQRGIECHVCVERNMACGLGTCQSCVVPVRDAADADGWSYRLCCTDGPVFGGDVVLWERQG